MLDIDQHTRGRADETVVRQVEQETGGVGVDAVLEMNGFPMSVNTAFRSVRRGGTVILFGLKSGPVTIPDFDRLIVRGITIHSIIGRQLFATWETTQQLLSDRRNGIQDLVWNVLLDGGRQTVIDFSAFTKESFSQALRDHPKMLIRFSAQ